MAGRCLLAVLAALATGAVGCGGEDTGAVEPTEWADDACTALTVWRDRIHERVQVLEKDVEAARNRAVVVGDEITLFLDSVVATTNTLSADIARAGIPDIGDGDPVARDLRADVNRVARVFATLRADAEDAPLRRKALRRELREIGATVALELGSTSTALRDIGEEHDVPELEQILDDEPACEEI